jgi:hypothetical protein
MEMTEYGNDGMTMNCEQFIFEAAYIDDPGDLGGDALDHLGECSGCRVRLRQLREAGVSEVIPEMSLRLHQAIDLAVRQESATVRPAFAGRMWLQMACACLVLIASIMGIAYQSHSTESVAIYAHR